MVNIKVNEVQSRIKIGVSGHLVGCFIAKNRNVTNNMKLSKMRNVASNMEQRKYKSSSAKV